MFSGQATFSVLPRILAYQVREEILTAGRLFPDFGAIQELLAQIVVTLVEVAFAEGLTRIERPLDLLTYVKRRMFYPSYIPYEAV